MTIPVWLAGHYYAPGDVVIPTAAPVLVVTDIANGNFDSGDTGWTKGTGWSIATDRKFNGTHSAKFNATGTAQLLNNTARDVLAGTSVTINGVVDQGASDSGEASAALQIVWLDAADVVISTTTGTAISSGSDGTWKPATVTGVAPAGTAKAKAAVTATRSGGSDALWVDNLTWNITAPDIPSGLYYRAVQAEIGASAANEPVWPLVNGVQVVDGDVTWEAVTGTRVEWTAFPIMESGLVEPTWPLENDAIVADGTIGWQAITQRITDPNCPQSKVWTMGASKLFAGAYDITRFCATNDARDWSTEGDAGYLPTGLREYGANDVKVLNIYRGNLVAMNSEAFQMWQIDPDPALMSIIDEMPAVGSIYQKAAIPFGGDLLYLPPLGVRSVGMSGATKNLDAGDVGKPIDILVRESLAEANADGVEPLALHYPAAGQYWLMFPSPPSTPPNLVFLDTAWNGSADIYTLYGFRLDGDGVWHADEPQDITEEMADDTATDLMVTSNGQLIISLNASLARSNPLFFDWSESEHQWVLTDGIRTDSYANGLSEPADGAWLAFSADSASTKVDGVRVFQNDNSAYTEAAFTTGTAKAAAITAWSSDGEYLAVGGYGGTSSSPRLVVSQRTGTSFANNTPATQPTQTVSGLAFTPDDNLLLVSDTSGNRVLVYQKSGANYVWLKDIAIGTTPYGLAVSPDGELLVVQVGTSRAQVYTIAGTVFTLAQSIAGIGSSSESARWSPDGNRLFLPYYQDIVGDLDDHVAIYDRNPTTNVLTLNTQFDALMPAGFDDLTGLGVYGDTSSGPIENSTLAYVFDSGSGSVGKWSRYTFPFRIDAWTLLGDDLVLRAGDDFLTVTPDTVTDEMWEDGEWVAFPYDGVVWYPWLDFGTPGADKDMMAFDIIGAGVPTVDVGYNQNDIAAFAESIAVPEDTLYDGPVPYEITAPSLSIRITFEGGTAWKLNAFNVYFAR